jgi:hypothetical protein
MVIKRIDPDHDFAEQYWVAADGTSRRWRAVQYSYTRRH